MNVKELKMTCRDNGLRGYSKLRKHELIEFLKRNSIPTHSSRQKKSTEHFGMSVEKFICDHLNLSYSKNHFKDRTSPIDCSLLQTLISNAISQLEIDTFLGSRNEQADFKLKNNKTLSVKTNYNGFKVCPQNIGQATRNKFQRHFKVQLHTDTEIKRYIIDNIGSLTREYMRNLFCCDYLLWVYKDGSSYQVELFSKQSIVHIAMPNNRFTFSRTLDQWNEGNTVRLEAVSIGEFQLHRNRNCIKFRFNMKKLISYLKLHSLSLK